MVMFTHEDGSVSAKPNEPAVAEKIEKTKKTIVSGNSKRKNVPNVLDQDAPEPVVGLSTNVIYQRKNDILKDLEQLKQKMAELDKQKSDAIALAHALNGAIQQCDDFLDKLGVGNNADSSIPQN